MISIIIPEQPTYTKWRKLTPSKLFALDHETIPRIAESWDPNNVTFREGTKVLKVEKRI